MSRRFLRRALRAPLADVLASLERCLAGGWPAFLRVFLGLAAGWWLYVPVHELLHALGCVATGGVVDRLEIGHAYGGALFAGLAPWIVAGGDYAGRLSGFDTGGSDPVYLATVFAPYLLTVFPGVYLLRRAGAAGRAFLFGLLLPVALAPFVSLTGDAYELGSILITQLPPWNAAETAYHLRGDDLGQRIELWRGLSDAPWTGGVLAFLIGLAWAFATYGAGRLMARPLERRAPPQAR